MSHSASLTREEVRKTVLAFVIGGIGTFVFSNLNLPVPWLAGPMICVATYTMLGQHAGMPVFLRDFGMLLVGVSMGSGVTPEAIATISRYPASIIGLIFSILLTIFVSTVLLQRVFGWDKATAYLSSVPGVLSVVLALAAQANVDMRKVALVQAVRLLVLVTVLPMVISHSTELKQVVNGMIVSPSGLAILLFGSLGLSEIMRIRGSANPQMMAGMLVGIATHVTGIIQGGLPDPMTKVAMLIVGIFCGLRFGGATLVSLARILPAGISVLSVALLLTGVTGYLVHLVTGLDLATVMVAYSPGAVEAMVLLGAAMGLDPLYIGTHHLLRAVGLNIITPLMMPETAKVPPHNQKD